VACLFYFPKLPLGGRDFCWKQAKAERKAILGKKACMRKATAGRKNNTRACMEDLMMLGLGFLQCIVMVEEPETYKYRYLGLIGGILL
jgi:hypothetical protein